ncbi:MAG: serine/threonine protein kinase [Proteobacteria bacterium]|nr:serine/threonine protein kinase [Pseudomonadota bacterium]
MSNLPPFLERDNFGRYEVICPIDQGGMASVYAGRLSSMAGFERLVAIKVIHEHLSEDPAFIKMFLDEARIAAGINHPNVGEIFEVGEDNGLFYMAGELIKGQCLRLFYRRAKKLDMEVSQAINAHIASKVCFGAHAAHELSDQDGNSIDLIHRDISPRNILISYDGFVKLIDFGVAWIQGQKSDKDEEAMKGKLGYMSPEQMRNEPMDRRSDIFSLGIVMYMMFTGYHPFSAKTDEERIEKLLSGKVIPPTVLNPKLDPRLEQITLTALAAKREDRYENAAVMGEELEDYARAECPQIGSRMLSEFMHKAFDSEMNELEERLREYRKTHEGSNGDLSVFDTGKQKEQSTPTATSYSIAENPSSTSKSKWIWMGGASVVIIGIVLGILFNTMRETKSLPSVTSDQTALPPGAAQPPPLQVKVTAPVAANTVALTSQIASQTPAAEPNKTTQLIVDETSKPVESTTHESVSIELDLQPTKMAVFLDGKKLTPGTKVIELKNDGLPHSLRFYGKGYSTETKTIIADKDKKLAVKLKPLAKIEKTIDKKKNSRKTKSKLKLKRNPY